MSTKNKQIRKVYFSMGEVCEMFDLPASTIRFWEKNFPFIKPKKNAKGNRQFTPEDVEILKMVYHLVKEKGMTLSGAQKYIKDNKTAVKKESNVAEILMRLRESLVSIRTEISTFEKRKANEIVIAPSENEQPEHELCTQEPEADNKPRYIELSLFD